jgi:hypothetical protein
MCHLLAFVESFAQAPRQAQAKKQLLRIFIRKDILASTKVAEGAPWTLKDLKAPGSLTVEHFELERHDIYNCGEPAISMGLCRSLPVDDP